MTAKEMFKKLGYIKYIGVDTDDIVYRKQNLCVEFSAIKKTVLVQRMTSSGEDIVNYGAEVDVALFQAIKKQLEELWWIE